MPQSFWRGEATSSMPFCVWVVMLMVPVADGALLGRRQTETG
jgi:hypothetical protein